ncbi:MULTISPECIES: DUF6693 family protein [unclassified Rhizobium]|uniref:DUF6693 family protein n=1 Tax=Rhizobium/Agrobacterium group TaxID=227290 RepID=UPI000714674C|nr:MULTISPECIES: DUF6693 family protein [unclassified Rhizobium]KQQ78961.1 hypothetical protein ASF70_22285 [Rhizobium sp. Leaf321]
MSNTDVAVTPPFKTQPFGSTLRCEYSLMEAVGYIILWVIISVLTLGIGAFFAVYYFYKSIINKTYLIGRDGQRIARLECELNLAEMIGHILIWILISIVTLGIGLVFYVFRTLRLCFNKTRLVYI